MIVVLIHSFFFLLSLFWAVLGLHCCVGFSLVVASNSWLQSMDSTVLWFLLLPSMGPRAPGVE